MTSLNVLCVCLLFALKVLLTSSFEQQLNDPCNSTLENSKGLCVEPSNCRFFKEHMRQLNICSFNKKMPYVCCPVSGVRVGGIGERINKLKCKEYSKLSRIDLYPTFGFVGGTQSSVNEFPHMAAIGISEIGDILWQCGGSLISNEYVLTAAHCAFNKVESMIVRVGDKNLQKTDDGANPQEFKVKRILIHPQYKKGLKYHDIALLQLSQKATFNRDVMPACLSNSKDLNETSAVAMGWGSTSFGGVGSDELLKGSLSLINNEDCNESYSDESQDIPNGIISSQICAVDPSKQKDTCQGDSGGPLQLSKTVNNDFKYYEIIGITSFGRFCASGTPGVYTRVSSYIDWIESNVWP